MAIGKKISAFTALALMSATAAAFPARVASAAIYDDSSYTGGLSAGDIVQIDTLEELCAFSNYVNAGGVTDGVTFELTADIKASNYSYSFDKNSGCVLGKSSDGSVAFCIGTGVNGTTFNTSTASVLATVYTADAVNGILTEMTIPEDAVSEFTTVETFNGTFNGNGYAISGLYNLTSLFGTLNDADVYNLTVSDSYFYCESGNAAGLAREANGTNVSYVTVEDTFVAGASRANVGGIVSIVAQSGDKSIFIACCNSGDGAIVNKSTSYYKTGGIVASTQLYGGDVFEMYSCYNSCDIYGDGSVTSGLVGYLSASHVNYGSLSTGTVYSTRTSSIYGVCTDVYQVPSNAEVNSTAFNFVTDEDLSNGKITYILENARKNSPVEITSYWTQNLNEDNSVPVLSSSNEYIVCCTGNGFDNGSVDSHTYSDSTIFTANGDDTHNYSCSNCTITIVEDCTFENGTCLLCNGNEEPPIVNDYYQISTYGQLAWFANAVNSETALTHNVRINNDISAPSGSVWTPIGTATVPYNGVFEGQRNVISGLNVAEGTYVGLFGSVSGASISYIGVENSSFSGTNYVGALAGSVASSTILFSYSYNNTIECSNTCGGFVATAQGATIRFSYTDSDKNLVGSGSASVFGCYHTGASSIGESISDAQISNGDLAYTMNQDAIYASYPVEWGQIISSDASHPILNIDNMVYCSGEGYDNESPSEHAPQDIVCNSNGTHTFDCTYCNYSITENCLYSDGFCSVCGYFDNSAQEIIYKTAGRYTLPAPKTNASDQVIGWIDTNGNLYPCGAQVTVTANESFIRVTLNLSTVGASVRLNSDSTGIKFATQFDIIGSDYDTLDISLGTLICPTDYVTNDSVFDYESFVANGYVALMYEENASVFKQITVNGNEYDSAYFGSVVNISAYNYAREFTGCGFAKIVYSDGSTGYFYASSKSSQSVYSLAAKAYGDRVIVENDLYSNATESLNGDTYYSLYTTDELSILENFIDGVVDFNIDLADNGEAVQAIPAEIEGFYESPYSIVADYLGDTITISAVDGIWKPYVEVQKNDGMKYQRVSVMINGKRVTPGNTQDNFEISASEVQFGDSAIDSDTLVITLVGLD